MPTLRADIPNLSAGETAFALDDGTLVTVSIEQLPSPDGHHIPLHVAGRRITIDGADVIQPSPFRSAPLPVRLPASVHTVQDAALSHTSLADIIERETAAALRRWPGYLLGLAALQDIPVRKAL